MQRNQISHKISGLFSIALTILCALCFSQSAFANNPPARCAGYGDLQSISLTVWEAGLGSWTVNTHHTKLDFDTPDWAVVGNLPDSRPGLAAFVADQNNGDCAVEDKSGALTLDSPSIVIPGGAEVPRISINHWFDTELGWDGGNLKIRVNGGDYNPVPESAIEFGSYNDVLLPKVVDGFPYNTNPLAEEAAFTGTYDSQPTGSWIATHINLLGIAGAGDSVKLRFDFGVDQCGGTIGWYVDEVEFYSCEAELPPSDCGNRVIDPGEQCDDGNDFIEDGCSNTCQIEEDWQCTAPNLPTVVPDHSFEAGTPNPTWTEFSTNPIGTPICQAAVCGVGGGTGPSDGLFWAWFGGTKQLHESSLSQSLVIPSTEIELTFELEIPTCDSASDYVELLIDGNQEFLINGSNPLCGIDGYSTQSVDIEAYADGGVHNIEFHAETFAVNGRVSNFFIDNVALPGTASECRRIGTNLTLLKSVNNDDGGTAQPSDWTLTASGPSSFSGPGPRVLSGAGFLPGTYVLSESGGEPGYEASDWVCIGGTQVDGTTVTLALDDAVTCFINNDDIAPTIKVVKSVINDSGGTVNNPNDFGLRVDGRSVLNNVVKTTDAGDHTVSEDGLDGYQSGNWGGDCNADGTISLSLGQDAICTITNDDISPTLTVINTVVNDNGGTVTNPDAFGLRVNGSSVLNSETNAYDAGSYTVSQLGLSGYSASAWGGDCAPDGTITLMLDQDAICTISNDDISPTLKVFKTIINDNGGVVTDENAFGLRVDDASVLHNAVNNFDAGNHTVSEDGLAGYQPSIWGGDCSPGGTITLELAENATCTITNDDTNETSLTLVKQLIKDSGGTASASEWTLTATGPTTFSGLGPNVSNPADFAAGTYTLSESGGPAGYSASAWVCVGGTQINGNTISLGLGQAAVCTITNDDIPGRLKVFKTIVNDDGGGVTNPDAFGLRVDGLSVLHDDSNPFSAGEHTVSEDGLPEYSAGVWGGDCEPDGTVTIELDQDSLCTITNDDIPPTLKVVKTIINDNGGTVIDENAFGLKVDDLPVLHNVANEFTTGPHKVTEEGLPGYQAGVWGGDCGSNGNVNLSVGEAAVCTITNDDISPTITVEKTIINDNGGTVTDPNAFGLRVDNGSVLDGIANEFDAGISHTVSEVGLPGYQPGTWGGDCNEDGTIILTLGQDATCTITNDDTDSTTLTLIKQVINDNGGDASGSDWILTATGATTFSGPGPNVPSPEGFVAGTYTLSQSTGLTGYTTSAWVCVGGTQVTGEPSVTLAFGEAATCTITSNDISPTLTVVKTILNDNNGTVNDPDAFGLRVDGISVLDSVVNNIKAGPRVVTEDGLPGYEAGSWGGDCDAAGNITLALAQSATCSITNDDIAPTLTVVNSVVNNNGGTVTDPDAFGLKIDGNGVNDSVVNTINAGAHTVSADGVSGYAASTWGGDCAPNGDITLVQGQDAVCIISHDDIAPILTVVKTIINDNGGTVTNPNFFGLRVDGNSVLDSAPNAFDAGSHIVSEDGLSGYDAGVWGGDCAANGDITLALGQNATCTITNDDADNTSLTLVKVVTNDNGGEALASDWMLTATGTSTFSGPGPSVSSNPGFVAGTYILSESPGPAGYDASTWVCDGGTQTDGYTIILDHGDVVTCTITNDDISPTITVVKTITNDDGGTESNPNVFGLRVDGGSVLHGATNKFDAGDHDVTEDGLDKYTAGDWGTDCAADGSITLVLGQNATCTITNDDKPPTIKVVNNIANDNGGTETDPDAFGLMVNGGSVLHDVANEFSAGIEHTVSQTGLDGYQAGSWGGDCDPNGKITLAIGQSATCTITNDDISPTLKVVKTINNDNGGLIEDPDAFGLRVDGGSVLNDVANDFDAGSHTVTELGLPGYEGGSWGGPCDPVTGEITLALDEHVTCTITNDDIAPVLELVKEVNNDNGGEATPVEWILTAADPNEILTGFSGNGPSVSSNASFVAGTYDLSESLDPGSLIDPAGYTASAWDCVGGTQVDGDTITLEAGDVVTCTIINDDVQPTLKIVNTIDNGNGGAVSDENAFGLQVDGFGVLHNVATSFNAGPHSVSQVGLDDYDAGDWGGDCATDGSITLVVGETATCTITNDDIPPTITVLKSITGGSETDPDVFGLQIDGVTVPEGIPYDDLGNLSAGNHTVSELGLSYGSGLGGYKPSVWGGDCGPDGNITLAINRDAICNITNTFSADTSLTLVKRVINDDGGSATGSDWTLTASDPDGVNPGLSGSGPLITSGPGFIEDTYDLSESGGPAGYTPGSWVCVGGTQVGDTISLASGDVAVCTITNDDIRPDLTVVKTISGGSETDPDQFGLLVDGEAVSDSTPNDFDAGNHTVSEVGLPNYKPSIWGGDCDPDGNITLVPGDDAVCTITNTYTDITSLTLVKQVINNNSGTAAGSDWTLTATDPDGINPGLSGSGPVVTSGAGFADGIYDLSESGGPLPYAASTWVCVGGTQLDSDTISLAPGEGATCTITNDDTDSTSLTLVKNVINDNGGDAVESEWILTATGTTGFSGSGPIVRSGFGFEWGDYVLSESGGPNGYLAGSWLCDGGTLIGNTISVADNEHITCTITNDDISPKLTLENYLPNDNGGTAVPDDFNLTVDGGGVLHAVQNDFNAGPHTVSQTPLTGYSAGPWGGDCAPDGSITLALGDVATCTITNDDISPTITVVKTIVNDNGGTIIDPNAFGLKVNGGIVLDSVANPFDAGVKHTVSEDGQLFYAASVWGGDCAADGTITLALDQHATCTVTNDDTDETSLTLRKAVINDNGGEALISEWVLTATDPNGILDGFFGNDTGSGVSNNPDFSAGIYDLSESGGPGGYAASDWVCTGNGTQMDGDTIALELGDVAICTITNDDITPTLTVFKDITNDNGGIELNENVFGLKVDGINVLHGVTRAFDAGVHTVTEDGLPGYQAGTWSGDCDPVAGPTTSITLALGEQASCTIGNNDISPTITVINTIIRDSGGTETDPDAFGLMVDGGIVSDSVTNTFDAGPHVVSQTGLAGYAGSVWGGDCAPDGSITLTLDQDATCTITNDDISPTITVVKTIVNTNGGTIVDPNAFGLKVNGGIVLDSVANPFDAGVEHTVSEDGLPFYAAGDWGGHCAADGTVTLALDQHATCTVTNDDTDETSLTLKKVVINDNGGDAGISEWTLTATDPNGILDGFFGNDTGSGVSNNSDFSAGIYDLSESGGPGGYAASDWVCTGNGTQMDGDTIALELGDVAICTITNDDITPTLTVFKDITNDNGGTELNENVFGLKVNGINVLHNVARAFDAGVVHTVTEEGLAGYQAGSWSGACAADGTVTLALGQNATCSITNNDISPTITVVNTVISDNGGTINDPDAFGLMVDGGVVSDSVTNNFDAGAHTISATGVTGYAASIWSGDCAPDGSITLALDQDAVCTITHNDISPTITVVKSIVNDNGGTIVDPNAFVLRVNGGTVLDSAINTFDAGVEHTVSEDGLPFYAAGAWGEDCAADGTITLSLGQDYTCTITNDDTDETSLTLRKVVINDNGGEAVASEWTLAATDPNGVLTGFDGSDLGSGVSNGANFSAGIYDLSESGGPGGYAASDWVCTGNGTQMDGDTIALELGDVATCTITNNDITPTLTVVKTITNNNGGTETNPNAFGLRVNGGIVQDGVANDFNAGIVHTVSEDGLAGYQGGSWSGTCAADGTVTLALAENATCSITNNDISPTITVVNTVISDNGGTFNDPDAFGLMVDGGTVSDSVTNSFDAGSHTVSANGVAGYQASVWGGDCAPDGGVTLALDQDAVCTITHNDISPTITVVKTIVNDNGGTNNDPNSFGLRVNGNIVLNNARNPYDAGEVHIVSEDGLDFYQGGSWGGDCEADGSILLTLEEDATCTIENDDTDETSLTLQNVVVNDNGGDAVESQWTLVASGPRVFSGQGPSVSNNSNFSAGVYDLSQIDGPGGYAASTWTCTGNGTQIDGYTISLELGDVAICTIVNDDITPTLKVVKNITNDNGGTIDNPNVFGLRVDGINVLDRAVNAFDAGAHTVSEDGLPEYQAGSWSGACAADGTVTLALGQNATCRITNDDISPTLTVVNTITNDNGGTVIDPDTFGLMVDGGAVSDSVSNAFDAGTHTVSASGLNGYAATIWGGDCAPDGSITLALNQDAVCTIKHDDISPTLKVLKTVINDDGGSITDQNIFGLKVDGNTVLHNVINSYDAGIHVVSEAGLAGYQPGNWGGDCAADGTINLALAQNATCTITNNDIAPTLTVIKTIVNDNGGDVTDENVFALRVDGNLVQHNVPSSFIAGNHQVSEDGLADYQPGSWGGDCNPDGSITLVLDQVATCTITNDDIPPTITVVNTITNDNGGTVTDANAFGLKVDGAAVLNNEATEFNVGVYTVSQDGLEGYEAGTWGGDCAPDGSITVALNEDKVCTITNDDITPTLKVVKTIINDNGGTILDEDAFVLRIDGAAVVHNAINKVDAGNRTVSEDGLAGYIPGDWGGDCNADGTISLALDQDATCTITNNDTDSTSLTLVKQVINDNGGTAPASEWTLTATGPTGFSGKGPNVSNGPSFDAGTYILSESGGPAGYTAGNWVCDGGTQDGNSISLALGDAAICTITNDDITPTLKVVKTIINDNGGKITDENVFGLKVDGNTVLHNAVNDFDAGAHIVSEDGLPSYVPGPWGGDCAPDGSITLALDQDAICTITNDDSDATSLTLVKEVVNKGSGSASPSIWALSANGPSGFSGKGPTVTSGVNFIAGSYDLSESGGVPGYTASDWVCVGGTQDDGDTITLTPGQNATCTITNTDTNVGEEVFKDGFE